MRRKTMSQVRKPGEELVCQWLSYDGQNDGNPLRLDGALLDKIEKATEDEEDEEDYAFKSLLHSLKEVYESEGKEEKKAWEAAIKACRSLSKNDPRHVWVDKSYGGRHVYAYESDLF